ncbi:hypothetical protein [Flavilitoribacter nigricans]|nr:hypothetical protein [Flavilitoribacter nigricans]
MKKLSLLALSLFLVVGTMSAQNPHINKKDQAGVVADWSTEIVCFSGVVAGNGNASSVTAYLEVAVDAETLCYNPAGGAKDDVGVPGHQSFTVKGEAQTFDCKNGKANLQNVCAALNIEVSCPNWKWTGVVEDVHILSVSLIINGKTLDVTNFYH